MLGFWNKTSLIILNVCAVFVAARADTVAAARGLGRKRKLGGLVRFPKLALDRAHFLLSAANCLSRLAIAPSFLSISLCRAAILA